MLVQGLLEAAAERSPASVAVTCGERRLSYQELDRQANQLAQTLRQQGVARGDRVAILLENSVEAVVAIFGALKADAIFVILHPDTHPARLAGMLRDAEPAALIADASRLTAAANEISSIQSLKCVVSDPDAPADGAMRPRVLTWSDVRAASDVRPSCRAIDVDLATLIYSSGSTGRPKGIMSTHANVLAATTSINGYVQNTEADVIIDLLPLSFDYGLYQLFLAFQVGARVVLDRGFGFPAQVVATIEREGVTGLPGVPTLFALLLRFPSLVKGRMPSLRYMTNTAAALPPSQIRELRDLLPGVRLFSMYGLTECKRVSYLPPDELGRRPNSVGIPIPNTEAYVVGERGERLPPGEIGELVVRGSHVMRGYWRAPELTAARFRPGEIPGERVLYTGDLFSMDEDGFLYFVGRVDDVFKSRGEKIAPREIEDVVCQMASVVGAAVVPVPDAVLGDAVGLFAAPRAGVELTERDVRRFCVAHLDPFMQPKYVRVIDELPRTENGKVDKRSLREELIRCVGSPES